MSTDECRRRLTCEKNWREGAYVYQGLTLESSIQLVSKSSSKCVIQLTYERNGWISAPGQCTRTDGSVGAAKAEKRKWTKIFCMSSPVKLEWTLRSLPCRRLYRYHNKLSIKNSWQNAISWLPGRLNLTLGKSQLLQPGLYPSVRMMERALVWQYKIDSSLPKVVSTSFGTRELPKASFLILAAHPGQRRLYQTL